MSLLHNDIIVALATPDGEGAISIVRVSGNASIKIVEAIFKGKRKLADAKSHTIHYGEIVSRRGDTIDDVLVSVFKNPNSYTGEDSVEISSHASTVVVKKIIEELLNCGTRLAEPGEFTRRAFLNGKLDLAQAEAVADIINSRTESSLRGARNQFDGVLSEAIDSLRRELLNTTSLIELELDFAEEDLEFVSKDKVISEINKIINKIDKLLKTYSFGRVIRDGVNVAIVGKPNVGKSSLLNYILKESRAIVSEIPGTTRDVIREEVSIDGVLFKLFDTAGIRLTDDVVEQEGVKRSREAVKNSDVVILIDEVVNGIPNELYNELIELIDEDRIIVVLNKLDLHPSPAQQPNSNSLLSSRDSQRHIEATDSSASLKKKNGASIHSPKETGEHSATSDVDSANKEVFRGEMKEIKISVKENIGVDNLLETLKEKAIGSNSFTEKSAVVNNVRHFNALSKAKNDLEGAVTSLRNSMSGEFISIGLRGAEESLGEIIGKVRTDDILNNIFDNFCIGK